MGGAQIINTTAKKHLLMSTIKTACPGYPSIQELGMKAAGVRFWKLIEVGNGKVNLQVVLPNQEIKYLGICPTGALAAVPTIKEALILKMEAISESSRLDPCELGKKGPLWLKIGSQYVTPTGLQKTGVSYKVTCTVDGFYILPIPKQATDWVLIPQAILQRLRRLRNLQRISTVLHLGS